MVCNTSQQKQQQQGKKKKCEQNEQWQHVHRYHHHEYQRPRHQPLQHQPPHNQQEQQRQRQQQQQDEHRGSQQQLLQRAAVGPPEERSRDEDGLPKLPQQAQAGYVLQCQGQVHQQAQGRRHQFHQPQHHAGYAHFSSGFFEGAPYTSELQGRSQTLQMQSLHADLGLGGQDGDSLHGRTTGGGDRPAEQHSQRSDLALELSVRDAKQSAEGDVDPDLPSDAVAADTETSTTTAGGTTAVPDFVKKLYRMLEDSTCSDAVFWAKRRDNFIVRDPNVFAKHVLPRHFKHNNFASFVRQLNKYDFHKAKMDPEDACNLDDNAWSFRHPNFHADKTDLLTKIKRKISSRGGRSRGLRNSHAGSSIIARGEDAATSTDDLITLHAQLQQQLEEVTRQQAQLAKTVESLSRGYQFVVDELFQSKHMLAAQDEVLQMAGYIFAHAAADVFPNFSKSMLPAELTVDQGPRSPHPAVAEAWQSFRSASSAGMHHTRPGMQQPSFHKNVALVQGQGIAAAASEPTGIAFPPADGQSSSTLEERGSSGQEPTITKVSEGVDEGLFAETHQCGAPLPGESSEDAGESASLATLTGSRSKGAEQPRPVRVLVVDDDVVYRQISGKLLRVFGCTCDVATDGIAAVNKMGIAKYDLVLMDISMPNLDGVSATTRIRQFDRTTPIICVSASVTPHDRIVYLTNGMNDVLAKPFSKQGLWSVLEKFCLERLRSSSAGRRCRMIHDLSLAEDGKALEDQQRQSLPIAQHSTAGDAYNQDVGYQQSLPAGPWDSLVVSPTASGSYQDPSAASYGILQQHVPQSQRQHQQQARDAQWMPAGEPVPPAEISPAPTPSLFSVSFTDDDHPPKRPRMA